MKLGLTKVGINERSASCKNRRMGEGIELVNHWFLHIVAKNLNIMASAKQAL